MPGYLSCCAPFGTMLNKNFPTAEEIANNARTIESQPALKIPTNLVNGGSGKEFEDDDDGKGKEKGIVGGIVDGVKGGLGGIGNAVKGGLGGIGNAAGTLFRRREEEPLAVTTPVLKGKQPTQPQQPPQPQKPQRGNLITPAVAPNMRFGNWNRFKKAKPEVPKSSFKPWLGPKEEDNRDRKAPVIEERPEIDGEKVVCVSSQWGCEYSFISWYLLVRGLI
jgi:hypothetical protein